MLASYYTLIGGPYICAFKMYVPYNCRAFGSTENENENFAS